MSDSKTPKCVIVPCGGGQLWAVPQACVAEIITIPEAGERPPQEVTWRGRDLPVLDLGEKSSDPWRNRHSGFGLVLVVLGLEGESSDCWGLAVRGDGLSFRAVTAQAIEDRPEAVLEHASAAFCLGGEEIYQVPDLTALQRLANPGVAA